MLTELGRLYEQMYHQPAPDQVPVHPAPVYETLASLAIFALLWWVFRKKQLPTGVLFGIYLVLAGVERLLVEFIRLNPLYLGLSQAQWISIGMIVLGGALIVIRRNGPVEVGPGDGGKEQVKRQKARV
jgi:phosphatidylglycerol:prolipoprotein diacylglycerol transferase